MDKMKVKSNFLTMFIAMVMVGFSVNTVFSSDGKLDSKTMGLTSCSQSTQQKKNMQEEQLVKGIGHVALYTDKFDETIKFYEQAFDAENLGRFGTNPVGCWLKIGPDILEIWESEKLPTDGTFKHIAIATDNVDELHKKVLSLGAVEESAPADAILNFDEQVTIRYSFVRGINGEQIELICKKKIDYNRIIIKTIHYEQSFEPYGNRTFQCKRYDELCPEQRAVAKNREFQQFR